MSTDASKASKETLKETRLALEVKVNVFESVMAIWVISGRVGVNLGGEV